MSEYSHMCRDGHEEIGFSNSEIELCPVCEVMNQLATARAEIERLKRELRFGPLETWSARTIGSQCPETPLHVIDTREKAGRELAIAKAFVNWAFEEGVCLGCDLDGASVQDKLEELGITELRPCEAGSPEAEEWGEGQELHYLKDAWRVDAKERR